MGKSAGFDRELLPSVSMSQIEAKIAAGRRHGRCSNRSGKSLARSITDRFQRTISGRLALPVSSHSGGRVRDDILHGLWPGSRVVTAEGWPGVIPPKIYVSSEPTLGGSAEGQEKRPFPGFLTPAVPLAAEVGVTTQASQSTEVARKGGLSGRSPMTQANKVGLIMDFFLKVFA